MISKIISFFVFALLTLLIVNCTANDSTYEVEVVNPSSFERSDEFVILDLGQLNVASGKSVSSVSVLNGDVAVPCQLTDSNNDGTIDAVAVILNFKPDESINLTIKINPPETYDNQFIKRTYAELAIKENAEYNNGVYSGGNYVNIEKVRVPDNHTDHNNLFKYEGPGWESDKVGYRFYLDWRNAVDIFGKRTNDMVLKNVGVKDVEQIPDHSYHTMDDWGVDILKVGNSLGMGSVGMLDSGKVVMIAKTDSVFCEVAENGIIKSDIRTNYYGWQVGNHKYNIQTDLSITAGSRLTLTEIALDNMPDNIVTGLVKHEKAKLIKNNTQTESEWNYIATYGNQTVIDDGLGMVVFFRNSDLLEVTEDEYSYIVVLTAKNNKASYYFGAAWEKEKDGIKREDEFISYLNGTINRLNNPVKVIYKQ